MSDSNCQKIKLLVLYEMLRQETDEEHPMKTNDILSRLGEKNITCDRRTLTKDMRTLNEYGFEVMSRFVGHEKAYYVEDRSFDEPEIRILADAVRAASFITESKTEELTEKIASLGGSHRKELLEKNRILFNTRKHSNESVYYTVDRLEEAITEGKQIRFRYFDLNEKAERVYRKGGEPSYVMEPLELVFSEDNYYLICYNDKYGSTTNFRIDRMSDVEILEDPVSPKALEASGDLAGHTARMFSMYSGDPVSVTIWFLRSCIDQVFDRFGEDIDIKMLRTNKGTDVCEINVDIETSPAFWGWIFQFAGDMQIIKPESLREEYENRAMSIIRKERLT